MTKSVVRIKDMNLELLKDLPGFQGVFKAIINSQMKLLVRFNLTKEPQERMGCSHSRVATVRETYLENKFFPGQGEVRELFGWPEKFSKGLESQGKVSEFENKCYGRQSSENLFSLFKRGKDVPSHKIVEAHLSLHWGLLLKERICSLGKQILSFKSNPQI